MEFFLEKKFIAPRSRALTTFPSPHFSFPSLLGAHKIEELIEDYSSYYMDFERVFYRNIILKKDKITSFVKGFPISLIVKELR